jgi:hypothetical protein
LVVLTDRKWAETNLDVRLKFNRWGANLRRIREIDRLCDRLVELVNSAAIPTC